MKLDEYQQKVVKAKVSKDCALRVVANAGAGKSTTMLYKVLNFIEHGVPASSIVVISFSRRSRMDLQQKWKSLNLDADTPTISTLHSLGLLILRNYLNVKRFKLIKVNEQQRVIKHIINEKMIKLGFESSSNDPDSGTVFKSRTDDSAIIYAIINSIAYYKSVCKTYSDLRNDRSGPGSRLDPSLNNSNSDGFIYDSSESDSDLKYIESVKEYGNLSISKFITFDDFFEIFKSYEKFKDTNQYYDYDDLISKTCKLLEDNPDILNKVRKKFTTYLVDESQDLNVANWKLIMLLSSGLRLVSVGDPCQNIYMFRYAKPEYFSEKYFKKYFSKVKNLSLPYNYRSNKEIVELGNEIRALHDDALFAKTVKNKTKNSINIYTEIKSNLEGKQVVNIINKLVEHGYMYKDITVICRSTGFINSVVEKALIEENLPYIILAGNNTNFHESTQISIFLSMLSIVINPNDLVAFTNLIPFMDGMGAYKKTKRTEKIGKIAQNYINLILKLKKPVVTIGNSNLDKAVSAFYSSLLKKNKEYKGISYKELFEELFYIQDKFIKDNHKLKKSQFLRLNQTLMNFINDYLESNHNPSVKDALHNLLLNVDAYDPDPGLANNYVVLSTVHAQKGLESKVSIVCGFRANRELTDLGDEKNILYVQLSRAIEKLIIIRSKHVRRSDRSIIHGSENPHLKIVLDRYLTRQQKNESN